MFTQDDNLIHFKHKFYDSSRSRAFLSVIEWKIRKLENCLRLGRGGPAADPSQAT